MRSSEEGFARISMEAKKHDYQILDDSIERSSFRCLRRGWTFFLIHTYEFHYADMNQQRHIGKIQRQGQHWLNIEFHTAAVSPSIANKNNVIAFPQRHPHDEKSNES